MKKTLLLLLLPATIFSQSHHELKDFLRDYSDLSTLPAYETGVYASEFSTYDRTGGNNDGFGGQYSFVRRNPDSTLVLLDLKGSGVINRFWTPTPTTDSLDFFIDRDDRPSFTINYMDLYSGKVAPFQAPLCGQQLGGYYCYLPIPFRSSCKIVLRGKHTQFHQIGYKLFPAGTITRAFSLPLNDEERKELDKIATLWTSPKIWIQDNPGTTTVTKKISLKPDPGHPTVIYSSAQGGRILGLELSSPVELGESARDIDFMVSYDGEKEYSVNTPLADFFGYAFGKASMLGLLAGSDGKHHYSWFPMPFDRSIRIELGYRTPRSGQIKPIELLVTTHTSPSKRDPIREGKFRAQWNRENPTKEGIPVTLLNVAGKGHFVGLNLQAQSLRPGITQNFEGDDSTVIDGETRFHGTGSEDFFNGGWYALMDRWDGATSLPLSGALEYSIPLGRTGAYRFFIGDKIPFEKSFLQTIEHGPEHNAWPSDYSSVSYYYSDRTTQQRVISNATNTAIYRPDTLEIYPQQMYWQMEGPHAVSTEWKYGPAMTMSFSVKENTLLKMNMPEIPEGDYSVFLDHVEGPDAARFSIWQRQTRLTEWIDPRKDKAGTSPMRGVGDIQVSRLAHALTFHFETPEGRDRFGLTRIVLVRKK